MAHGKPIIALRTLTIIRPATALLGFVLLAAVLNPRFQDLLLTAGAIGLFLVAMLLMPRAKSA